MTPKEILLKAAEVIERRGHYKCWYCADDKNPHEGPVCAVGALSDAIVGCPDPICMVKPGQRDALEFVKLTLCEKLGVTSFPEWNDRAETTAQDVIDLFRSTANEME